MLTVSYWWYCRFVPLACGQVRNAGALSGLSPCARHVFTLPVPRCHSYTPARELTTVCTRVQNTPSLLPMMMHLLPTSGCLTTLQHWVSTPAGSLSLCACLLASGFPCDALATRCRIFVGGDSAGGHLAAGVCLDCRDRGIRQPVGQILVYPATDHTMGAPSVTA